MKKKLVALLISMTTLLTACGTTKKATVPQNNLKANITYNTDSVLSDTTNVINTASTENATSFTSDFIFDKSDITAVDENYRGYYSDGAYYIQTGTYMYRFQFNTDGLIESYIKYNLEG